MTVRDFIDNVASGNAAQAKESLNDLISARAFESLDAKKTELAQGLFVGKEQSEPQENEEVAQ